MADREYQLRWEHQYMSDARLIHPDFEVLERSTKALTFALERKPEIFPIYDQERHLRAAHVLFHLVTGPSVAHVEPLIVSFRIERPPPNGLVSLRRVVTERDLRLGLHEGDDDLPPPENELAPYSWS